MNVTIDSGWEIVLKHEFKKTYFENLTKFVKAEYRRSKCYPKGPEIFAAFNYCSFDNLKVVIIGQDPYHGSNQANGLCFSVHDTVKHPPSLINIFKEIQTDTGKTYPLSGNLEHWAKQGVLLLNATLTVREGMPGSHQNQGWEEFTSAVIEYISNIKEGIVFLLWGGFAKKKGNIIDKRKHFILESGHPSPLSANRGYWFGNKHFSKTNELLTDMGKTKINW